MDIVAQLNARLSGRYAIDREIGAGGMATVYLARDLKHNRKVALKVLRPELGAVLGPERFLTEIQVTANLQHPHLLPLFDSGEADGLLFYVMPYVEGESLRARLERERQLPVDEAIRIAQGVASALDYAHRHGVVHRDLKPENILLHDGQPLVADFGIALAISNAGGARVTQTGLSLGTPQYMSPEQAAGDRVIDARSDIYSLAAMLYEMLVGDPPHAASTVQGIIAKVLTERPRSVRSVRDTVPLHVDLTVERALAKLPADRWATAHEFAEALVNPAATAAHASAPRSESAAAASSARQSRGRVRTILPWSIAALATAAVVVLLVSAPGDDTEAPIRFELKRDPFESLGEWSGTPIAISPHGRHIAYIGIRQDGVPLLYLRASDDERPRAVPGSEQARQPFFSPDGKWVAFIASSQLMKAPVEGGNAVRIGQLPVAAGPSGGISGAAWAGNNRIILSIGGKLHTIAAAGGSLELLAGPDTANNEVSLQFPVVLGDGNTILYTSLPRRQQSIATDLQRASIGIGTLSDRRFTRLTLAGHRALGVMEKNLIYVTTAGTVMAIEINLRNRTTVGTRIPLFDVAVRTDPNPRVVLSPDGALLYARGSLARQLMIVQENGAARPLNTGAGDAWWPRFSPDGNRLAFTQETLTGDSLGSRRDIWVYTMPNGPAIRLTKEGRWNDRPEWTRDGRSILFRSDREVPTALWLQPADGSAGARLFFSARPSTGTPTDEGVISPDGRYLLFQSGNRVWYRLLEGDTTVRPVTTTATNETGARFSPDGKWIAYTSYESGTDEVYVRPFPSLDAKHQVSADGAGSPVWSRDGSRLYYSTAGRCVAAGRTTCVGGLIAATIRTMPRFEVVSREAILEPRYTFQWPHADFDVLPDGKTFVIPQATGPGDQLIAVLRWDLELRARLRGAARQ